MTVTERDGMERVEQALTNDGSQLIWPFVETTLGIPPGDAWPEWANNAYNVSYDLGIHDGNTMKSHFLAILSERLRTEPICDS